MRKALLIIVVVIVATSVSGCYRKAAPDVTVTPVVPTQTPWVITEETEVTREVTRVVEAATRTPTAVSPTPTPVSILLAEELFQSGDRFNAIKTLWQIESQRGFENLPREAIRLMERIKVSFERDYPQMNAGRQVEGGGWWQSELALLVERESGCQVRRLVLVVITEGSSLVNYYDLSGREEVGSFVGVNNVALSGAPAVRVILVCDGEEHEAYWLLLCANKFYRVPKVETPPPPLETPEPTLTRTPVGETVTPVPRTVTPLPTHTPTPLPTHTPTPLPTETRLPTSTPTRRPTATPTKVATATPHPTITPQGTPEPSVTYTPAPTQTPVPTATDIPPTATKIPSPEPTATAPPSATPRPTATP